MALDLLRWGKKNLSGTVSVPTFEKWRLAPSV